METLTSSTPNAASQSFFARYKFTLISLLILILAIVPLAVLSKQHKTAPSNTTAAIPTPTVAPFTSENAEPTIEAMDKDIQSALQQTDTDVQAANQVDASQDNVTGL